MHDTIEFEKRGIAATVIITENFKNPAVWQFRSKGMPGHPFVALPHPVSNLHPEEMREVTLRYIDQVVRQIVA